MNQVTKPNLPIGYWLKQAGKLLTEKINEVQAANGVSRFEWQVLNLICEAGSASQERIFEIMHIFIDASGLDDIIRHLIERGWIDQRGDEVDRVEFQPTEEGQRQSNQSIEFLVVSQPASHGDRLLVEGDKAWNQIAAGL